MKKIVISLLALAMALCCVIGFIACKENDDCDGCGDPAPEVFEKIEIDYKTMTYVGTSLKDFSSFFDEQDKADPENGIAPDMAILFLADRSFKRNRILSYLHYISNLI